MSLVRWKKDEVMATTGPRGSRPHRTTLAAVESLAVPLVQEVVFLADFRCARCQKRVAEIMAKMNGETQSVVISVLEKKVTLTCTYPNADKLHGRQVASVYRSSWSKAHLMVMRLNLDCNACCRKMRRILLRMKEIETHMIEKQQHRVTVCGRFVPAEVAIKIRKKMNRRVEILEIQELGNINEHVEQIPPPVLAQPVEQMPPVLPQPV
ncbi:hypothetical protein Salat_1320400 [Sesamum alatum]|uniref:HMA domain-containing protein n=1 Tax=Sesamum alatum TaxID=300844 RepID=A0AAE1YHN1_9LAMI|nr:hypothetical protein Salat_1320400 [Sesamum alatum]